MGIDKIAVVILAENKIFVRLQPRQNCVTTGFIRDVFADQPHCGLRRFQLAYHVIGKQQREIFRLARFINPRLRRAAL